MQDRHRRAHQVVDGLHVILRLIMPPLYTLI